MHNPRITNRALTGSLCRFRLCVFRILAAACSTAEAGHGARIPKNAWHILGRIICEL